MLLLLRSGRLRGASHAQAGHVLRKRAQPGGDSTRMIRGGRLISACRGLRNLAGLLRIIRRRCGRNVALVVSWCGISAIAWGGLLCGSEGRRYTARWRGSSSASVRTGSELVGLGGIASLLLLAGVDVAGLGRRRRRRWLILVTTIFHLLGVLLWRVLALSIKGGSHVGGVRGGSRRIAGGCRGRLVRARPGELQVVVMRRRTSAVPVGWLLLDVLYGR